MPDETPARSAISPMAMEDTYTAYDCQANRRLYNHKAGVSTIAMFSALGIDYGTNSVRALVVDCDTGKELGTAVVDYPSGNQGVLLDKNDHHLARQNPADYLSGLEKAVRDALGQAGKKPGFSCDNVM